jgi:ssDNA-binding Zn-finger/Zn-ribbon topoisomerase 1
VNALLKFLPGCTRSLRKRISKDGEFWASSRYPDRRKNHEHRIERRVEGEGGDPKMSAMNGQVKSDDVPACLSGRGEGAAERDPPAS